MNRSLRLVSVLAYLMLAPVAIAAQEPTPLTPTERLAVDYAKRRVKALEKEYGMLSKELDAVRRRKQAVDRYSNSPDLWAETVLNELEFQIRYILTTRSREHEVLSGILFLDRKDYRAQARRDIQFPYARRWMLAVPDSQLRADVRASRLRLTRYRDKLEFSRFSHELAVLDSGWSRLFEAHVDLVTAADRAVTAIGMAPITLQWAEHTAQLAEFRRQRAEESAKQNERTQEKWATFLAALVGPWVAYSAWLNEPSATAKDTVDANAWMVAQQEKAKRRCVEAGMTYVYLGKFAVGECVK